ncbi:MAG: STAS domain-containing protein [Armatimonadota bacterium]|nr:STAS domain-containing protein [Armatimonadota bacterium]
MEFAVTTKEIHLDGSRHASAVSVAGEVDVFTAPRLRETLLELERDNIHHVVLDLERVAFMDSVGLGVLLGALRRARAGGGNLVLCGASERLRRLFEITGLSGAFLTAEDVKQGLELLNRPAVDAGGPAARGGQR